MPGALGDVARPARVEQDPHARRGLGDHAERGADVALEVEVGARPRSAASVASIARDPVDRERAQLARLVVVAHHVEPAAAVPDAVGVERARRHGARAARAVADPHAALREHRVVERADRLAQVRIALVRPRQHAERRAEPREIVGELGPEPGADLRERGADRVVEDRALEHAQEVLAEREREDLVGRERHVAEPERVEEAVEHAAVALLAHHREAREHQRVEVAVDGAAHHLEIGGEIVERHARAALREALDQLPLPRELVAPHPKSLLIGQNGG